MLKFFRMIRRSLLESGRISRYLLYALGEILLLVIGILIALQINNWNDGRKNRAIEQQILHGLKVEFEDHLTELENWLIRTEDLVSSMRLFMTYIAEPDSNYSLRELDRGLWASLFAGTWDPASSKLIALISSGQLQIIRDPELQKKLAGWGSVVDEVRDNQETIRNHASASMWSMLAENGTPNARGWGNEIPELHGFQPDLLAEDLYRDIRGNLTIVDLIAMKYTWTKGSINEIQNAIQEAKGIISLIDKQIK